MKKSLLFGVLLAYPIFNAQAKLISVKPVERIFDTKNENIFTDKRAIFIDKSEITDSNILNEKLINYIAFHITLFKHFITPEDKRDELWDPLFNDERHKIIKLFKDKKMIITNIESITDHINNDQNDFELVISISGNVVCDKKFNDICDICFKEGLVAPISGIIFNKTGIYLEHALIIETFPSIQHRIKIYPVS